MNSDTPPDPLSVSARSSKKVVSLSAYLAERLSSVLHARSEFSGQLMSTVAMLPDPRSGVYDIIADISGSSSEGRCNRFVVPQEGNGWAACGVCVRFDSAPVAVILWASFAWGMTLLDLIEEVVNTELRHVRASGSRLSKRELEVIAMSADGMTSAEIAGFYKIAETRVNARIASAMRREAASTRTHLVAIAVRNGYI